jgi:hypothetical protein
MRHPDLDLAPSTLPFDRHLVIADRVEMGALSEERFYVLEFDLPKDDLGPMRRPPALSEAETRTRLAELGLSETDIQARLNWAKTWMATRTIRTD